MTNLFSTMLYIDPGTGSMLFSLFIGLITTGVFGLRALIIKIHSVVGRGKKEELDHSHLNVVIYSDHKRYWNVFEPVVKEFENRGICVNYFTQSPDDPALCQKFCRVKASFIGEGNKGFLKMNMLNAELCIATTPGLDVLQWKRSRNCKYYIHVPHMLTDLTSYRMFALDHYDAVLTTGEYQIEDIRKIEEIRKTAKKEMIPVGFPLMDELSKKVSADAPKALDDVKTVLLAPSWGKNGILSKFGQKILSSLKETGFNVIVRPHPQSLTAEKEMIDDLMKKFPDSENFSWNFDNSNFDCLKASDILISDFSGVIYEYAFLFNRPVIYADVQFDSSVYDAAWIDHPMWCLSTLEKIGVKLEESQFSDMKNFINNALESQDIKKALEEAKSQAWCNRGNSAKTIVDFVQNKLEMLKEN